jgi:NurA-like 5'-3' nuclease
VVLDFGGVQLVSFSFADEFVGRLLAERASGDLGEHAILISNANEDVLAPIEQSLQRRDLITTQFDGNRLRLLNAPDHLQETLDAALVRRTFRTSELAEDLGITVQACNNRLHDLSVTGLLSREESIARAGGRGFIYQIADVKLVDEQPALELALAR